MSYNFNHVPGVFRYPGVQIEIDGSQAGLINELPTMLLVGQKLATGTAPAGEITRVNSVEDAKLKAGEGSMLHKMAQRYRSADETFALFMLPYSDNPAGVAATGTIQVTNAPTSAGTLSLYVAGKLVSVGVAADDTVNQVAIKIAAAITAAGLVVPVTAAANTDTVTLTALHKGSCGNDIDIRINFLDQPAVAGLGLDITAMAGGTGDPAPGDLNALLGTYWYKYVALGINDNATLSAWHVISQSRYQPPVQQGFRIFGAARGDYDTAITFGSNKNYEHVSMLAVGINPDTPYEAAASYAAAAATKLFVNPVVSLEGRKLEGMLSKDYFDWTQANNLLFEGMSVLKVGQDGSCYIVRAISMYVERQDGTKDTAWLDINAAERQERYRYIQRIELAKLGKGKAAAKNAEGFRPGLPIITEDDIKAKLLSMYQNKFVYDLGWNQNFDYYKTTVLVNQNANDPSRFDFKDNPIFLSPFYSIAGINQFLTAAPSAE